MAGLIGRRLLAIGSAAVVASIGWAYAQDQRDVQPELVQPEVQDKVPPLMVEPAEQPQKQNPQQLMTSLRRAQEALQLDDRKAAMQALMEAEEQLDQVGNADVGEQPLQRIDRALQEAMKALAEDNPRYALTALQEVTESPQGANTDGGQNGEQEGQPAGSVLESMPASEVIGAEVVDDSGETIAEVRDIVRARAGGDQIYAILDVGGFLGIADKEVALELDRLRTAEDDKLVLPGITESQLEEMPTYEQGAFEQLR